MSHCAPPVLPYHTSPAQHTPFSKTNPIPKDLSTGFGPFASSIRHRTKYFHVVKTFNKRLIGHEDTLTANCKKSQYDRLEQNACKRRTWRESQNQKTPTSFLSSVSHPFPDHLLDTKTPHITAFPSPVTARSKHKSNIFFSRDECLMPLL